MKRKLIITAVSTLAVMMLVVLTSSPALSSANKSCSKLGSMSGTQAKPLVCKTVKGKRIWVTQVVLTVKRPPSALSISINARYLSTTTGILLTWGYPHNVGSSPIIGYRLEVMTEQIPWAFVIDVPANQLYQYVTDAKLSMLKFRFRIAAQNIHGLGEFSESDWVLYGFTTPVVIPTVSTTTSTTSTTSTTVAQTTTTTVLTTNSKTQAFNSAKSYLRFMPFSRSSLIKQLEYEKFSLEDATYGVDAQNADWNTQASKSAASYLKIMSFSRAGLIAQLMYEGFTQSQAEYGVNAVGL